MSELGLISRHPLPQHAARSFPNGGFDGRAIRQGPMAEDALASAAYNLSHKERDKGCAWVPADCVQASSTALMSAPPFFGVGAH